MAFLKSFAAATVLASFVASQDVETGLQPELSLIYLQAHAPPPFSQFRLPPTYFNPPSSPSTWQKTPAGWFEGTWYFFASNQVTYLEELDDVQWTMHAIGDPNNTTPTNLIHDVVSSFYHGTSVPVVVYGVDTPIAPDAYAYQPTGPVASTNNTWEYLAWGYDTNSAQFAVVYETPSSAQTGTSLDFFSRSKAGISAETFEYLKKGIASLNDTELNGLLAAVQITPQDDRRDGQPYPSCDSTCMTNSEIGA